MLTELYYHQHYLISRFNTPRRDPAGTHQYSLPPPPLPSPRQPLICFLSVHWPVLDISPKRTCPISRNITHGLLWLVSFTQHHGFRVTHMVARVGASFLFTVEWYFTVRLLYFVYLFSHQWARGLFPPVSCREQCWTHFWEDVWFRFSWECT